MNKTGVAEQNIIISPPPLPPFCKSTFQLSKLIPCVNHRIRAVKNLAVNILQRKNSVKSSTKVTLGQIKDHNYYCNIKFEISNFVLLNYFKNLREQAP